jgi:hypothetical protein
MESMTPRPAPRSIAVRLGAVTLAVSLAWTSGCAQSVGGGAGAPPELDFSTDPPSPDPRVGLRAGTMRPLPSDTSRRVVDRPAAETSWNLRLVSHTPSPEDFAGVTNSDLAFTGNLVIQGNYNGFQVWDVSNPSAPRLARGFVCPASQSDVSVFENLLFVSGEGTGGRLDCGTQGVPEPVSPIRLRGIRIFDISDIQNPDYVGNVQTCRGSHTHSLATQPGDDENVYIYVSGSSSVRSPEELPGCSNLAPNEDPNSSLFRVEVIQVPLDAPETARIVTGARIFQDLVGAPRRTQPQQGGRGGGGGAPDPNEPRPGPNQCHDITTYPDAGYAGGACQGYGILLDIRDVTSPERLYAAADTNFATWHSVTFSNDGTKVLFTDEWGGGSSPRCRASDPLVWGGNAIFEIVDDELVFQSYYKMPAAQTEQENCVAHNGSLIPVPGRDIKVQGWYQGGISIFDWTDARNPVEIAYFDRGPLDAERLVLGGSWSAYWHNGLIYSSEIARGLDVFELVPSGWLTENEIEAAKTVHLDYFNVQQQQRFEWPATFVLARAFLDQLQRDEGLGAERIAGVRAELARAEGMSGGAQRGALTELAAGLDRDAAAAGDAEKVRMLRDAVRRLAEG